MRWKDLVLDIQDKFGMTKKDSKILLESIFGSIQDALLLGQEVNIRGFWKFYISKRRAKIWYNPRTWQSMQIDWYKLPAFKAGGPLKKVINNI